MRRTRSKTHPAASLPRADRHVPEDADDTYSLRGKLPDPTACPSCGAIYRDGRWAWGSPPAGAHETPCPACRRIEEDYPAGLVTIEGAFAVVHRKEILGLARNLEARERQLRPLKRIMRISDPEGGPIEIATTDSHLARAIGTALQHAYEGELDCRDTGKENLVRVRWRR